MRFFIWLLQTIKGLFTKPTPEPQPTTFTLIDIKPALPQQQDDPMECLENFTEVSLTV